METADPRRPEPFAAGALATASVAAVVAMAFHPTGHDLLHDADPPAAATRIRVVHATVIAALWLETCGLVALVRRLRSATIGIVELAFASRVLAAFAGTFAAMASGFLAPLLAAMTPLPDALWHQNGHLNRVFAQLFVVAGGVATTLWAWAGRRGGLPRWIVGLGLAYAPLAIVLIATGALRLGVHGMGAVVLLQAAWHVGVAITLWRTPPR